MYFAVHGYVHRAKVPTVVVVVVPSLFACLVPFAAFIQEDQHDEEQKGMSQGLEGVGMPVDKPRVRHLGGGLTIKDRTVSLAQ